MKRSIFIALTAAFVVTSSAFADSVTVTALGAVPQGSNTAAPGVFAFSINGTRMMGFPDQTPGMPIAGQSWTATAVPFTDYVTATFGADADALQDYEAAAWLISQAPKGGPGGDLDIQMAILALFNPSIEQSKPWNEGAAMWLNKAEGNSYSLSEFAGFQILVPTNCMTARCTSLEFIVAPHGDPAPAPTPEPASMVLVGLGLLALGSKLRNRLARSMS